MRYIAFLIVLLAGCGLSGWREPPGKYASYRDVLAKHLFDETSGNPNWPYIPPPIREKLAGCMADREVAAVDADQLRVLDAAARGEADAPPELRALAGRQIAEAVALRDKGDFSELQPFCPADYPSFQSYAHR